MAIAFIALGSNKVAHVHGQMLSPPAVVRAALVKLDEHGDVDVVAASGLYRSAPIGPGRQRPYINAVAALRVDLAAPRLLGCLHDIEADFGRARGSIAWKARPLDLDLVSYGYDVTPENMQWQQQRAAPWPSRLSPRARASARQLLLCVPHLRADMRSFVMTPLAETAPQWVHPVLRLRAAALAQRCGRAGLSRIGPISLGAL